MIPVALPWWAVLVIIPGAFVMAALVIVIFASLVLAVLGGISALYAAAHDYLAPDRDQGE